MALYKATDKGNIPMTAQEEAEILQKWEQNAAKPIAVPNKTLEQRVQDLETAIALLSK